MNSMIEFYANIASENVRLTAEVSKGFYALVEQSQMYHGVFKSFRAEITQLRDENENLQAINDALNQDLDYANETIAMYEEEEAHKLDDLLDRALDEMLLEAKFERAVE